MEENKARRSTLGTILTTVGAVLGVISVMAYRIQLKATVSPDNHQVTLIRSLIGTGALIAFGLSAAMIIGGALLGRRRRLRDQLSQQHASAQLRSPEFETGLGGLDVRTAQDVSSAPEDLR